MPACAPPNSLGDAASAAPLPQRLAQRGPGGWIFRWRIGTRLFAMMALGGMVAAALTALGVQGLAASAHSLQQVYAQHMQPVRTLSQIAQLMQANQHQLQLALVRTPLESPPTPAAPPKLDKAAAESAANTIERNYLDIDALWAAYSHSGALAGTEKTLADAFAQKRAEYLAHSVKPTIAALRSLDHTQTVQQAARAHHLYTRAHSDIQALIDLQFQHARSAYETGMQRYERTRTLALWMLPSAMLALVLLGWWQIRSIVRPLHHAKQVFRRMAQGRLDSAIAIPGRDEISSLLRELQQLQHRLADNDRAIHQLAYFDALTGLPNRVLLRQYITQALQDAAHRANHRALLLLDLDNFKTINDTLGHEVGDHYLAEMAQRLRAVAGQPHFVARIGGDEFVILTGPLDALPVRALHQALTLGQQVLDALATPCQLAGQTHHGSASVGLSLFHSSTASLKELLKRADLAMYQAKNAGRNQLCIFDPAMQNELAERTALTAEMRQALTPPQWLLHYQPLLDRQGRAVGAEALLRWQHPSRGLVAPAQFIPLAEANGLIVPIGQWVLEQACAQLAAWQKDPATAHLELSVNVSARQFRQTDFAAHVLRLLEISGIDATRLVLELTESLVIDDLADTRAKMLCLAERGVRFALDDFGTGYASLSVLHQLPLHLLKIDRSFVQRITTDAGSAAIVHTIVSLAHSLGLHVVAEGVETPAQHQALCQQRCHYYQGYLFARPLPPLVFDDWLRAHAAQPATPAAPAPCEYEKAQGDTP